MSPPPKGPGKMPLGVGAVNDLRVGLEGGDNKQVVSPSPSHGSPLLPSTTLERHWQGKISWAGSGSWTFSLCGQRWSSPIPWTVSSLQRLYTSLFCRATARPTNRCTGDGAGLICGRWHVPHKGSYPAGSPVIPYLPASCGSEPFHRVSSSPLEWGHPLHPRHPIPFLPCHHPHPRLWQT